MRRRPYKSVLSSAMYLCEQIKSPALVRKLLGERLLPTEIAFFMGDLIATFYAQRISTLRESLTGSDDGQRCNENCINVLNYARQPSPELRSIACERLMYKKLLLPRLAMTGCHVADLRFERCDIDSFVGNQSRIGRFNAVATTFRRLTIDACEVEAMCLNGGKISLFETNQCTVYVDDSGLSSVNRIVSHESLWAAGANIEKPIAIGFGSYEDCVFVNLKVTAPILMSAEWRRCTFVLCQIDAGQAEVLAKQPERLLGCRGILVCADCVEHVRVSESLRIWRPNSVQSAADQMGLTADWHSLIAKSFHRDRGRILSNREVRSRLDVLAKVSTVLRFRVGEVLLEVRSAPASMGHGSVSRRVTIMDCNLTEVKFREKVRTRAGGADKVLIVPWKHITVRTVTKDRLSLSIDEDAVGIS